MWRFLAFLLLWLNAERLKWIIGWLLLSMAVDLANRNYTEHMYVFGNLLSPFAVALVLFGVWGLIQIKQSFNPLFILSVVPFFMWQALVLPVKIVVPTTIVIFVFLKIIQRWRRPRV